MLTEKDYCDYETWVALKELGYSESFPLSKDYEVLGKDYDILLYEAQKFLREEKKIIIVIVPYTYNIITETSTWTYEIWLEDNLEREVHDFKTYEEALSEGVCKAIEILKILKEG